MTCLADERDKRETTPSALAVQSWQRKPCSEEQR